MTGQNLIDMIKEHNLENHEISTAESDSIAFSMAEVRNPTNDDDVAYIDLVIDFNDGTSYIHSF